MYKKRVPYSAPFWLKGWKSMAIDSARGYLGDANQLLKIGKILTYTTLIQWYSNVRFWMLEYFLLFLSPVMHPARPPNLGDKGEAKE